MKQLLSLLVAAAVVLTIMAGCSGGQPQPSEPTLSSAASQEQTAVGSKDPNVNPTGLPIVKEPITVTCLYPRKVRHGDFNEMWFTKELAKKTGITIKFEEVEESGWKEKKNLAFATDTLPDIFLSGLESMDESTYGSEGLLTDLSGMMKEYAPTISGLLEKYPQVKRSFTFENGSIFCLPTISDYNRDLVAIRPFINNKWLDKVGLNMPKTLDELYTVLKAFKEKDPNGNGQADEIPLSGQSTSEFTKLIVLSALGYVSQDHDIVDGKYQYVRVQPQYKDYLTYMNKLYTEGLLDNEFFIQADDQFQAKRAANLIGATADGSVLSDTKGDDYLELKMLPPLTSSVNSTPVWKMNNQFNRWGTFAITKNCKHPEAMMRLVDYLYSQEGSMMVRCGPEIGKWDGQNGYEKVTIDGIETGNFKFEGFDTFYNFRLSQTIINAPFYNDKYIGDFLTYNDNKQKWITEQSNQSGILNVARTGYPDVKFTEAEQDKISAIWVDINENAKKMEAQFITGEAPLTEWDNYVAAMKKLGADEMTQIRQTAYERWTKS